MTAGAKHPSERLPGGAPKLPGFWQTFLLVYGKDTRVEWRSPGALVAPPFFGLILAAVYAYALDSTVWQNLANLNGALLATLFFTSAFASARNMQNEKEDGALRVMLTAPADGMGLYLGKSIALWQLQAGFAVVSVPLYHILLRGQWPTGQLMLAPLVFLPVCALSLAALGVLLSYVASGNRLREILLPLLLFPVSLPVMILAVEGMRGALSPGPFVWSSLWVALAPAAIFLALGSILYPLLASED